jgi:DNA polymerase elongation subunit (family B)
MEKNQFFTYSWHIDEDETERTIIRIYGLNSDNESVCIIVNDFLPYVYLELPENVEWDDSRAGLVVSKLNNMLQERKPITYELVFKKKLYYANIDSKQKRRLYPYLRCCCSHPEDIRQLGFKVRKPMNVAGIGAFTMKMHEHNANPILQLTSLKKLPTAGWIAFAGKRVKGDDQITHCKYEYNVKWENMAATQSTNVARPLLMGYDIEVNSSIPSSMPKAHRPQDKIFQVSCVFARQGCKPDAYERYLLTLGEPDTDILGDNIDVLMYETESDLLLGFVDLIQEKQPNICIGYNIFTFDIPYMIDRAKTEFCMYDFDRQGMTKYGHAKERTIEWSSSAYKNQSFQFLDAEGRLFVDLLPLVRRDYKMNNYQLKTIAAHFLKDMTKDPLDAKAIFKCYRLGIKGGPKGKKAMGIVGKYCVKDSELVVRLFETLTTWIALCEMSKVTNVPIFQLYTQGQQLKVFSQAYKKCTHENTVVEKDGYLTKEHDHYVGATVFPPIPGVYDKVVPFDFSSLYPTTIIAYNISWDTLVEDEKIPDEFCNVMEWDDHIGCVHDPKEIRKTELNKIIKAKDAELKDIRKERDLKKNSDRKEEFKITIADFIRSTKPYRDERSQLNKSKPKHIICQHRKYRWIKAPMGVLPEILTHLLDTRSATKKEMKGVKAKLKEMKEGTDEYTELSTYHDVLDQRQLALKVSANSGYGCMGVRRGYLPFMPGAMCTTYMGRKAIEKAAESIQKDWKGVLVYGDSVSADTPILLRYPNESINVQTIDTLGSEWIDYDQFKPNDQDRNCKEQSSVDAEIWTKGKWSKIIRVIRHKTNKKMYRILTHTGCVDVTEDHSMLRENGEKVKPEELKVGDNLLHSFPTEFTEFDAKIVEGTMKGRKCVKCKETRPLYEFYTETYPRCKKCCYYTNHRNEDSVKPYFSDFEYLNKPTELTREEAFVWGFFMADGAGGKYDGGKYSWAINNQNIDYLNRAKMYLEKVEPNFTFKILDTMESSHVYKLVPVGKVRLIAEKYHQIMYDKNKNKIVPYAILNSSREIKEWFFEGYYTGDGYKPDHGIIIPKNGSVRMDCKGKIGAQGLYLLLKSIGYENVSVNTRETKPNIFRINGSRGKPRKNTVAIKKILPLQETEYTEYVYDIETEEGIFHAGIGELVVKNTDSNYINFPHLQTAAECWDYSIKVATEVSKLFPKPMSLAYEEKIYWRFFILTKKRYMSLACERDGKLDSKISKKGVLLQRRDNCAFIRKVYGEVVMMIFDKANREDVLYYIITELNKLCGACYPTSDFIVTKSVGDIGNLEPYEGKDKNDKPCHKIGDYKVKLLPTDEKKREYQFKLKKCTTEQEYYLKCLPAQAQLAEKMRERGQLVAAGSRLEYVITMKGGHTAKQYEKVEDSEYFSKHANSLEIDYMYYLKQLANPLDQILDIIYTIDDGSGYKIEPGFMLRQYKYRLQVRGKMITELKSLFTPKLKFV